MEPDVVIEAPVVGAPRPVPAVIEVTVAGGTESASSLTLSVADMYPSCVVETAGILSTGVVPPVEAIGAVAVTAVTPVAGAAFHANPPVAVESAVKM